MHVYMYIYIYIYTHLSLSIYIYIYIYTCMTLDTLPCKPPLIWAQPTGFDISHHH